MWLRRLGALCIGLTGSVGVVGLVIAMNAGELSLDSDVGPTTTEFAVAPKPKPKPKARKKPQKKPKKKAAEAPPPLPMVGANLDGLAFGLDALLMGGTDSADSLLGDVSDVVMTEDSVDEVPRPVHRVQPAFPERARKKGIGGHVQMSLRVSASGLVEDVRVLESKPPGMFDEAATSAVKQWRFEPAQYEGRPVAIRVTLPMSFGFDAA